MDAFWHKLTQIRQRNLNGNACSYPTELLPKYIVEPLYLSAAQFNHGPLFLVTE